MNAKRLFFSFVLLAVCGGAFAQTQIWTQMPGSPGGTTRHDDICFVNETNGWSARGLGGIFKTTDGGNTWVQKTNMPNTHFRAIGFVSATRGFAGNLGPGSYDPNVTDTNILYQTDDGGETWSVVAGISETGMKGFCAMHVLDSQHIYGGGRVRGPAHFTKSENGGTNWTVVDLKAAGVMGGIMDVYFKDPLNGFVVGMDTNDFFGSCGGNYHGRIAKTTDGGATWAAVADTGIACSYFWKMSWPTPDVGYVSLQQNSQSANSLIFYKTIDGGNTWVSNGIPFSAIGVSSFFLQGIGFVSTNEGWAGGASATSPYANNFLHTTNGGASWAPAGYNDSRSINRVRFYENFGVASGAKLHIFRVPQIIAPSITTQPQSQTVGLGANAVFSVNAAGTGPLSYQWRFNGSNLSGETKTSFVRAEVEADDAGNYSVVMTNSVGSVTSSIVSLTVVLQNALLFADDYESYNAPSVVTNAGITNGYKIFFGAAPGVQDFKAIFGFDYSTVTHPLNIPPAPNSAGGLSKGLFLAVNKDATPAAAAVNLYPLGIFTSNHFSLKFDVWLNWTNLGSSTEHALFGINHSGVMTNRIGHPTSDGLFFAIDGDGNVGNNASTIRDYAVFRGAGNGATPILMITNNVVFGPTLPLGSRFDNNDAGFANLFPSKTIPGYPTTPVGTPGLGWVSGEVRQENDLITWRLNGATVAQYTNLYAYTKGAVMIGYNDTFEGVGNSNVFMIIDNVRVEKIFPSAVVILTPEVVGNESRFSFATSINANYLVEQSTNLAASNWTVYTNFTGTGNAINVAIPLLNASEHYFRVRQP